MNRADYPDNWEAIALSVKTAANWTCENCGRPCRRPGESVGALIERVEQDHSHWAPELWVSMELRKLTRFTLTTAHPNHDPENPNAELRAWCAPCHCRYDLRAMPTKRRLKRERLGQLNLLMEAIAIEKGD
jgi:hypothetical protein